MISSMQNSKIQLVRKLLQKRRFREKEKAYVAEGVRLLEESLTNKEMPMFVLYNQDLSSRGMEIISKFQTESVQVEEVETHILNSISDTETSQGILGVFSLPEFNLPDHPNFVLILDEIRDPGNLGTIMRTSAAVGLDLLILTRGSVDAFSPKVIRSGMGAHFKLPILSMDWNQIAEWLQHNPEITPLITDVNAGKPVWEVNLSVPTAFVIGNEAHGCGTEAEKLIHSRVHIPMPGEFESLNAAVAAGIFLYETSKQRSQ